MFYFSDEHFLCDEMCVCVVHIYKEVIECQVLHARLLIDQVIYQYQRLDSCWCCASQSIGLQVCLTSCFLCFYKCVYV